MNRDDFAQAVLDRLPKDRPATGLEIIQELFNLGGATAKALHELPLAEVEQTQSEVCHVSASEWGRS